MRLSSTLPVVICITAILGILWPTSFHGQISSYSTLIGALTCTGVIFYTAFLNNKLSINIVPALIIVMLLIFFTLVSDLPEVNLGAIGPYLAMLMILCIDFNGAKGNIVTISFLFISGILLIISLGILFDINSIVDFVGTFYQQYFPELFQQSVVWHSKPVSVFGTHSVAAFTYFSFAMIFLYLSRNEQRYFSRIGFFVFAILFLILLPFLKSVSAFVLFIIAVSVVGAIYVTKNKGSALFTFFAVVFFVVFFYLEDVSEKNFELIFVGLGYLSSKSNGFLGRYTEGSRLDGTYDYMINHPLTGVGFTSNDVINFGDSFMAEYVLRISVFGYFLLILMLFYFLSRNIADKKLVIPVFIFFLLTDLGYPLLVTFKFIILLPLLVLVLNRGYYARRKNE